VNRRVLIFLLGRTLSNNMFTSFEILYIQYVFIFGVRKFEQPI